MDGFKTLEEVLMSSEVTAGTAGNVVNFNQIF